MSEPVQPPQPASTAGPVPAPAELAAGIIADRPRHSRLFTLRRDIPKWQSFLYGILCVVLILGLWHFLTVGEVEERTIGPNALPSIQETFRSFPSLWFERALTRNTVASLKRVAMGFGLAIVIGIPIGVLCGCFPWINSFFAPLTIFGRNIPVAALIPLTFSLFGIGEFQKVMFIFVACIAFVVFDTSNAIAAVGSRYIDTAYTLGATRRQIILKVLVPLAMPSIFNSLRLLFGLAFGYIMLAELIKFGDSSGGLGDIINVSQRRGTQTHIMLVLMLIPLVALAIDRTLFFIQCQLFPYQYGGAGILNRWVRSALHGWEGLKGMIFGTRDYQQVVRHGRSVEAVLPASPAAVPSTTSPPTAEEPTP